MLSHWLAFTYFSSSQASIINLICGKMNFHLRKLHVLLDDLSIHSAQSVTGL